MDAVNDFAIVPALPANSVVHHFLNTKFANYINLVNKFPISPSFTGWFHVRSQLSKGLLFFFVNPAGP